MLRQEVSLGRIKGVSVGRGAPQISHLLFTDNNIIFCRATREEGNWLINVLKDYEEVSGKKIPFSLAKTLRVRFKKA